MTAPPKENSLLVHAFVLMAVGIAVAVFGVIGIVKAASAKPDGAPAASASAGPGGVVGAQQKIREAQRTQQDAKNLARFGQRPTLAAGVGALQSAARLGGKVSAIFAYLVPILVILAGAGMGVVGFFVLQRKDWARYLGFGLLGATLIGFIVLQAGGSGLGDRRADMAFPVIAIAIVTLLCAKFLWDLFVEKFEQSYRPALPALLGFVGAPILVSAVGMPWRDLAAAEPRPAAGGTGEKAGGAAEADQPNRLFHRPRPRPAGT